MTTPKQKQVLFTVWALTLLVWLPPARHYFFQTAYFFSGVYGMRDFGDSVHYLLLILAWSVILSIPKFRTEKNIIGAASSFLTLGLLLQTYASLSMAGSLILLLAGFALLFSVTGAEVKQQDNMAAKPDQVASKAPLQKGYSTLPVWVSVILLAMPWLWKLLSGQDFFLRSMRSLQDIVVAAPLLGIMGYWAVLLSFPAKRTFNTSSGAAASLLAMAVFFQADPEFFGVSLLFLPFWQVLMNAESIQKNNKLRAAFFSRKVKKIYVTPTTIDSELASYYQAVSQKIDSYIISNFPSGQDKKLQGQAYVSIPIKEDGSIYVKGEGIKLETSSGNHELDLAALSIARRSGPFPGFSKCKSTGRATEVRVIFYRLGFEDKLLPQEAQLASCA
ncbi:energy transducer TonB [Undibacterium sp. TC9W]|uniref:energy transducer TonB n=1 Tax=Undibacterium sp. TC9W TaxID=3413053 RepID=UPI003BF2E06A